MIQAASKNIDSNHLMTSAKPTTGRNRHAACGSPVNVMHKNIHSVGITSLINFESCPSLGNWLPYVGPVLLIDQLSRLLLTSLSCIAVMSVLVSRAVSRLAPHHISSRIAQCRASQRRRNTMRSGAFGDELGPFRPVTIPVPSRLRPFSCTRKYCSFPSCLVARHSDGV